MKIKKNYLYTSRNQIWRLLPTETNKLILEERNLEKKEVYFSCLFTDSGKKIFKDYQLEEKFWVGIETVHNDIIFFHKFEKPDMPAHKGIIAFDINEQTILWQNDEDHFLFIAGDKLFSFKQNFDSRKYFVTDYKTGQIINDSEFSPEQIIELKNASGNQNDYSSYRFPETFYPECNIDEQARPFLLNLRNNFIISGKIDFILLGELVLFNFHEPAEGGFFRNIFKAVDLSTGKYILEEVLAKKSTAFVPDSFFVKDDLIFLLFEKNKLGVYSIIT